MRERGRRLERAVDVERAQVGEVRTGSSRRARAGSRSGLMVHLRVAGRRGEANRADCDRRAARRRSPWPAVLVGALVLAATACGDSDERPEPSGTTDAAAAPEHGSPRGPDAVGASCAPGEHRLRFGRRADCAHARHRRRSNTAAKRFSSRSTGGRRPRKAACTRSVGRGTFQALVLLAPAADGPTWSALLGSDTDLEHVDRALARAFARCRDRPAVDRRRRLFGRSDVRAPARARERWPLPRGRRALAGRAARRGRAREAAGVHRARHAGRRAAGRERERRRRSASSAWSGYPVTYRRFVGGHEVRPAIAREAVRWFLRGDASRSRVEEPCSPGSATTGATCRGGGRATRTRSSSARSCSSRRRSSASCRGISRGSSAGRPSSRSQPPRRPT